MDNWNISMFFIPTGAAAFIICLLLMATLIWIAPLARLIDSPSGRKRHEKATPLVGGIAVYLSVNLALISLAPDSLNWSLMLWLAMVLVVGVIDDRFDISYLVRILCHSAVVVGVFFTDSLVVTNVGAITGGNDVVFVGAAAVVFTIFAVIGAVNAVNMMDGLDGLLGSLALISILVIFGCSTFTGTTGLLGFDSAGISAFVGALVAFLLLNSRIVVGKAELFLGDAGSTVIGFLLVYLLIDHSMGTDPAFSPVLAGWILGLPLLDASAVIAVRFFRSASLFKPDRSHLHHLLLDSGKTVNQSLLSMILMHCALIATGLLISIFAGKWADFLLFWGFVLLVLLRVLVTQSVSRAQESDGAIEPGGGGSGARSIRNIRRAKLGEDLSSGPDVTKSANS